MTTLRFGDARAVLRQVGHRVALGVVAGDRTDVGAAPQFWET